MRGVAAMTQVASLIDEIETALATGTRRHRHDVLMQVTDLFMTGSNHYSDEQVMLFGEIFMLLTAEMEEKARARLSNRLATVSNAPRKVIVSLAFDDSIAVAAPVLKSSPQLSDDDLIANARTRSQDHLHAIAQRSSLSEAVTDVLVDHGDRRVVVTVTKNSGARFSDAGFGKLVERARGDDGLARHVGMRPDIPREHFLKLLASASARVRAKLEAANPQAAKTIREAVSAVASDISREVRENSREHAKAKFNAVRRYRSSELTESHVHAPAREQDFEKTVVAFALYGRFPVDLVERALVDDDPDLVLILAKAAGCTRTTARAIVLLPAAKRQLSPDDLEEALARFDRLRPATARRLVKFYEKRSKKLGAEPKVVIKAAMRTEQLGAHSALARSA